jgi:hypothetical protein
MDAGSKQVPNPHSTDNKLSRYSLWLGVAGIALFLIERVLSYFRYSGSVPIQYHRWLVDADAVLGSLSVICGLLAILMGRIAYRRNRVADGNQKNRAAQVGIVLGILLFIPVCLSICGYILLALATGT